MPDNETPELIPRLRLSRNWENPSDFSAHQRSEVQNRRDLQSLFTEITSYINNVMLPKAEQLLSEGGGGSGAGGGVSGDFLPLDGGTMRGILRLWRNPELDAEAVTKYYVDAKTNGVRTDIGDNVTAVRQQADAIELIAQNNKGDIASLKIEADAISSLVQDALGNFSEIRQTALDIFSHVENANGDYSEIKQTATEISSLVEDTNGNKSEIIQKADEISTLVEDGEGNYSAISQRADEISTLVENIDGDHSEIKQKADEISALVENCEGDYSEIKQKADEISALISDESGDNFSEIVQKINEIRSLMQDEDNNRSEITQKTDEISAYIENSDEDYSQVTQKVDEISALISDRDGQNYAQIIQRIDEISARMQDIDDNYSEITQKTDRIATLVRDADNNTSQITQRATEISTLTQELDENGDEERASEIRQKVDEISAEIRDAEGNSSLIDQKINAIRTLLSTPDGDISSIRQLLNEISTLIEDSEGNMSQVSQTSGEVSVMIRDTDNNLSQVKQSLDEISARLVSAEGNVSSIRQTLDDISMGVSTVTDNGQVYSRLTLQIGPNELYGFIKMEGNVDVSGQLSAEALYSSYGEVANMAVDQLITSRRIVKYLQHDTSDDNFLRIYQQKVEWVTGKYTEGVKQARNPNGFLLYWPVDVSELMCGDDGYPVTEQHERVFTTTMPTGYPVRVYTYEEAVKRSISFESVNGIYSPIDRFGAGNESGNNKAWILKTADGFDIRYLTPDGKEIGIRMATDGKVTIDGLEYDADKIRALLGMSDAAGTSGGGTSGGGGLDLTRVNADGSASGVTVDANGYTDVEGMRKVVNLDFSGMSSASSPGFSETLEGGVYNAYTVERDNAGRISKITDASGHETMITWG